MVIEIVYYSVQSRYEWCMIVQVAGWSGCAFVVTLWTRAVGVVGVWVLQQGDSRVGCREGSGDGPRVHTGIVTPHFPCHRPRQQIPAAAPYSRHNSYTARAPTRLPPPIYYPHYPPGENSSVLCVRVYTCVRTCAYVCVRT